MENKKIYDLINKYNIVVIGSHIGPDGDNIGSSCALKRLFKNMKKTAYYVMDDEMPTNMKFLYDVEQPVKSSDIIAEIKNKKYLFIGLDSGNKNRLKCDKIIIENASDIINIDHHASNEGYGDVSIVNPNISSTCQLVYEIIKEKYADFIDPFVATSLYTGIVTDSGNFMFDCADSKTLNIAAELLRFGANKAEISEKVFRSNSLGYLKLLSVALKNIQIHEKIALMSLDFETIKSCGIAYNDIENIVNYAINIDGIKVGLLVKEKSPGDNKVSLRSKGDFDVSTIAQVFGGGGHKNASGCTIKGDFKDALKRVLDVSKEKFNSWTAF